VNVAEDLPDEGAAGSGADPNEPITHHPAPVEPGGEADYGPVEPLEDQPGEYGADEPEIASAGVVFEPPPREGEADEFEYHTGVVRASKVPDAIEFVDVHKSFGRNHVLRGLNMGIPEGQISMIIGPSGTGKSVCIKHIVGLLYPDEGDVVVHGRSIPSLADAELFELRRKFGVLFQDGALFGSMNLYDNVAFPLRQHTEKSEEEIAEIVNGRMREVGLGGDGTKMPNELSGGMRKRAGFARALVLDPEIVLFDEPDSGLDPVRTALLCELIKEVHAENGGCYVVITHDIMSARRVAEHISVLWKGRIVESGPASELFASENPFVRQFLSGESQGPLGME
jgi:phospholipid/cholesterol/gamma-HCH transport system ATP-binding protein